MKKAFIGIIILLIILSIAILATQSSNNDVLSDKDSPTGAGRSSFTLPEDETVNQASKAESLLGISLPSDAYVSLILDNDLAVAIQGQTNLSIEEARAFFSDEMADAGYSMARQWGLSPADSDTLQSASYSGKGENWAFNLNAYEGYSTFDIQRQY